MFRILTISAWLWAYVMARTFIWPNRLEGLLWIPSKSPDSWYNLTDLKGRIHQRYIVYVFLFTNITTLIALLFIHKHKFFFTLLVAYHLLINIWWPSFFELKCSWGQCCIISICTLFFALILCLEQLLFIILIPIPLWITWISLYTFMNVEIPTTTMTYRRRESRTIEV